MVKSNDNHGSWLISSGLLNTVLVLLCAVAVMARVGPFDCSQARSVLCAVTLPSPFCEGAFYIYLLHTYFRFTGTENLTRINKCVCMYPWIYPRATLTLPSFFHSHLNNLFFNIQCEHVNQASTRYMCIHTHVHLSDLVCIAQSALW